MAALGPLSKSTSSTLSFSSSISPAMAALTRLSKSTSSTLSFSSSYSLAYYLATRSFASSNRPVRLRKDHKGRMHGISCRGVNISFGSFGLQALESSWITARQIEAGRRAMQRCAGKKAKIWVRLIADKSVTKKPIGTRMGSGKGAPQYTVAVVKRGRMLYEVDGVPENVARKAVALAASKMPVKTAFRTRGFCTATATSDEEIESNQQSQSLEEFDDGRGQLLELDLSKGTPASLPELLQALKLDN